MKKLNNISRIAFVIITMFTCACHNNNYDHLSNLPDIYKQPIMNTTDSEYEITARFNSFDTTVTVLFEDTYDSISNIQKINYEGFLAKQDLLTPDILRAIFQFYLSNYPTYKAASMMTPYSISESELDSMLPPPTTPEALKPFIIPAVIHIQKKQDCREGSLGIEFNCTWDIEHGVGVIIKDWKVTGADIANSIYFLP